MNSFVYIHILFHSAEAPPLVLEDVGNDIDRDNFSLSMIHIPKNANSYKKIPVKAYRLTALSQFIMDTNYESINEDEEQETLLVNADDIQAFPGGILYSNQYIVCFNMKVSDLNSLNFKIRVLLYKQSAIENSTKNPVIGRSCESFHNGRQFKNNSTGTITGVLLTESHENVGNISFDYLITSPWVIYEKYFSMPACNVIVNDRPLMIGHRGSGCSYCPQPSKYLENTINSFVAAEQSGADFIELDVQLTRDKAVIVFHDFLTEAIIDIDRAREDYYSRIEIPIRDLSHHQLKKNKFKHAAVTKHNDTNFRDTLSDASSDDGSIFPLLSEIISSLPKKMGIDIEVKFPQQESNGSWELEGSYFDRNTVVERVLEEVYESNKNIHRPIMLSSFDPGICVMLRQKQKHYPVFFLMTSCHTGTYMDSRCRTIKTAVTFCLAERLQGLCAEINPIVNVINKVTRIAHTNNLLFMTWGSGNSSVENIEKQKACKVDGIIFDRVYDFLPKVQLNPDTYSKPNE